LKVITLWWENLQQTVIRLFKPAVRFAAELQLSQTAELQQLLLTVTHNNKITLNISFRKDRREIRNFLFIKLTEIEILTPLTVPVMVQQPVYRNQYKH
jgi:hypothetical protein